MDPISNTPAIAGTNQYAYGSAGSSGGADGSGLTLQVAGKTVLPNAGGVVVTISEAQFPGQWGWPTSSPFTSIRISNTDASNAGPVAVNLDFVNQSQAIFNSVAPPPYLSLADFNYTQLTVVDLPESSPYALSTGFIDSLTEVPEPTAASLFGVAAAGWLVRWRRQRARRSAA